MTTLIVCRGLPGSGKTTRARAWVAEDPASRARVNRDDLRAMIHDGVYLGPSTETQIVAARDATILALLAANIDVVVDETTIETEKVSALLELGAIAHAHIEIWDLCYVPLDVCIARDAARDRPVGADVIRGMHAKLEATS